MASVSQNVGLGSGRPGCGALLPAVCPSAGSGTSLNINCS